MFERVRLLLHTCFHSLLTVWYIQIHVILITQEHLSWSLIWLFLTCCKENRNFHNPTLNRCSPTIVFMAARAHHMHKISHYDILVWTASAKTYIRLDNLQNISEVRVKMIGSYGLVSPAWNGLNVCDAINILDTLKIPLFNSWHADFNTDTFWQKGHWSGYRADPFKCHYNHHIPWITATCALNISSGI